MMAAAHLIVVDDERPQLDALCTVLEEEGHTVLGCATPGEALRVLGEQRFDVMLSDLNMPEMDGIALIRRSLEIDPDLVPVLMTGQGSIPTAVQAMQVGALDYVLKPFRLAAIRPVLQRAIEIRGLRVRNRELQEAVTRRTQQLEAANRELDSFAARIAHDLRGPLLAVLGFSRIVQELNAGRLVGPSEGYLARVIAAGERGDRMIADLLAFARMGDKPVRQDAVDLGEVLHRAQRALDGHVLGREVEWIVAALPTVRGDASLLEQVFVNLLSNALKYSGKRAKSVIEVSAQPAEGGGHTVSVRDNGVGFDPAYAERLFSPFQRLHRVEEFEGNGMGLANVRRIVERHGGTVSAESALDAEATFRLWLPGPEPTHTK